MNIIKSLAATGAAALLAALLAACSSGPHGSPVAATPAPAVPSAAPAASAAVTGRLTMKQAEVAYLRIVGPGNALANTLASAASGTAPFSQFRTAAVAYAKELRAEIGKFQAVRWPAKVQSHMTAMIRTGFPADISCLRAEVAADSMSAVQAVTNTHHDCMVADNFTIPSSIQSMVG